MQSIDRPTFLDLLRLSYPPGAVASTARRVTGIFLAIAAPICAYAFGRSVSGPEGFAEIVRFLPWLAGTFPVSPADGFEQWRAFVAQPTVSAAFALFFVAAAFHVWVSVRDIVLDCVHRLWTFIVVFGLVATGLFAVAIWPALVLVALHVR